MPVETLAFFAPHVDTDGRTWAEAIDFPADTDPWSIARRLMPHFMEAYLAARLAEVDDPGLRLLGEPPRTIAEMFSDIARSLHHTAMGHNEHFIDDWSIVNNASAIALQEHLRGSDSDDGHYDLVIAQADVAHRLPYRARHFYPEHVVAARLTANDQGAPEELLARLRRSVARTTFDIIPVFGVESEEDDRFVAQYADRYATVNFPASDATAKSYAIPLFQDDRERTKASLLAAADYLDPKRRQPRERRRPARVRRRLGQELRALAEFDDQFALEAALDDFSGRSHLSTQTVLRPEAIPVSAVVAQDIDDGRLSVATSARAVVVAFGQNMRGLSAPGQSPAQIQARNESLQTLGSAVARLRTHRPGGDSAIRADGLGR